MRDPHAVTIRWLAASACVGIAAIVLGVEPSLRFLVGTAIGGAAAVMGLALIAWAEPGDNTQAKPGVEP